MLVLTRSPGETVCVGEDVLFTVLDVRGNQVRIGVTAPKHVLIDRSEVRERKLAGIPPSPFAVKR